MNTEDGGESDDIESDGNDTTEPFTRYQNSVYRYVSMGGAALIAILGITGFAIGRTLDPIPPPQFFFIDGIVTVVLFGWYLLGMRCRLDVAETWVHIATKYGDTHIDRDRIDSIEPDRSLWASLQWSGRPLIVRYRAGENGEKAKSRKAYGCLPNDAEGQERVIAELQAVLGAPEDVAPVRVEPDGERVDLHGAVAARLATMEPEGDLPDR